MKVFVNGRILPEQKATVSVSDHSFLYGDGIYETFRVYAGRPFMLAEHLSRLKASARMIFLPLPWSKGYLARAIRRTLKSNNLLEAVVRLTVSRGEGPRGLDPRLCKRPTLVILPSAFTPYPPAYYQQGVPVWITSIRRNHPLALNPRIKSNNFLNNILAWKQAQGHHAVDGILLNQDGFVAEATTSNVFLVNNKRLLTPSLATGILPGVTREVLLRCARRLDIKTEERLIQPQELFSADECFLAGTTIEVLPIRRINGRQIRQAPGPQTTRLHQAFQTFKKNYLRR